MDKISGRDALHTLFELAKRGQSVDGALIDKARAYVNALESDTKHDATIYESLYPEIPKNSIKWQQPTNRKAVVWTHEFKCAVCGRGVSIQTHSPNAPSACDRDDCQTEHRRALARERKRRQRAKQRRQRKNSLGD